MHEVRPRLAAILPSCLRRLPATSPPWTASRQLSAADETSKRNKRREAMRSPRSLPRRLRRRQGDRHLPQAPLLLARRGPSPSRLGPWERPQQTSVVVSRCKDSFSIARASWVCREIGCATPRCPGSLCWGSGILRFGRWWLWGLVKV